MLDVLRAHSALEERRPGEFFLSGKEFLHFHESADGVVADVLLARGRVHVSVSDGVGQAELLDRIDQVLSSLESRARERRDKAARRS